MSHAPFSLSPDLKRLRDEGYFVQIRGGFLIMRDVPYVNAQRQVQTGSLISSLEMAGDVTCKLNKPGAHVATSTAIFLAAPPERRSGDSHKAVT